MQDRTILFNRVSALVREYELNGDRNNLEKAMYDCLKGYIKLNNQEIQQLENLNFIVDIN